MATSMHGSQGRIQAASDVPRAATGTTTTRSPAAGGEPALDRQLPLHSPAAGQHGGAWEQVYPGNEEQLARMRAAIRPLLDNCPVADDVVLIMSELAANAVRHSRSGREGGTFTARLLNVPGQYVLGEIEDGGSDWGGDLQRSARDASGLYILLNLTAASGVRGDRWRRVVWFRTQYAPGSGPGPSGKAEAA